MYTGKKSILFSFCLIFFIFFNFNTVEGQSRSDLEKKREQTKKDIEQTNHLLAATQQDKSSSLSKLVLLNKRIQLRNEVISSLSDEIDRLQNRINNNEFVVNSLEEDLLRLKRNYAKMIYYAYKNRDKYTQLMFILSAKDFNTAYKRLKYLQQYTKFRQKQAKVIQAVQSVLNTTIIELQKSKEDKLALLDEKKHETEILNIELGQQKRLVTDLQKKEKELKLQLAEKEKIANKLESEIERLIALEAKAKKGKSNDIYSSLTPEEKLVSDDFQKNKGLLPWPTSTGVITGIFGEHDHPVLKGIKVRNNGIDISTRKGAEVRAMFKGEVTKVLAILGANYTVIIRHGNFLTVYQNLVDVTVKSGDHVNTKQVIGKVYSGANENASILHLEIWEELNKLNPADWLAHQ
jgi:septal ring factor EnvC (AmiA/AmiB activator)